MPGLFGIVAKQTERNPVAIFDRMQSILKHQPFYGTATLTLPHAGLGIYSTSPWFKPSARLATRQHITLMVEGTALTLDHVPLASDTADIAPLLLDAYLRDGSDFIRRVGGHFSIAILDGERNRVELITDRMGFSHTYWYSDDHVFMFGPELKAFLAWEGFDRRVDEGSLAMMLAKECPYGTRTLFRHVHMLAPGTRVVLENGTPRVSCYWKPQPAPVDRTTDEIIEQALALFQRSIEKRVPASWEGRVLLPTTGGLDSRLLAWLMRNHGAALEMYTHGQSDCTDYRIAQQIATALDLESQHRLVPMNPDWAADHAKEAVWLNDGQLNMRNATLIGVSKAVGAEPVPFLNGIIGQHMSVGVGSFVKPAEVAPLSDETELRKRVLGFSGAGNAAKLFPLFMNDEHIASMESAAAEHAWEAYQPLRHIPLFGDQKVIFINQTMGARMQGTVDVHKFFFHDLLPFVDDELMNFWLSIPLEKRLGHTLYKEMYRRHLPRLAEIPWAETGKNLFTPEAEAEASLDKRMRKMERHQKITRYSLGVFNPRDRDAYAHRERWLRKHKSFRGMVSDVLHDTHASGMEYFDQAKVDHLFKGFLRGRNYWFKPVLQVASTLLWHEQFVKNPPKGAALQ